MSPGKHPVSNNGWRPDLASPASNARRTHTGENATDYRQMTIRLPDETLAALDAVGRVVKRPMWRVMVDAVAA